MYKIIHITDLGKVTTVIKRTDSETTRSFIPMDENNSDYQEYLRWLEAGNTPEPAEENQ
jgi:hypothetical protein